MFDEIAYDVGQGREKLLSDNLPMFLLSDKLKMFLFSDNLTMFLISFFRFVLMHLPDNLTFKVLNFKYFSVIR